MGSLNNPAPDVVEIPQEPILAVVEIPQQETTIIEPPKQPGIWERFIRKIADYFFTIPWVAKIRYENTIQKIESGETPRGRSDMNELPSIAGEVSGIIGGAVLRAQTKLVCRHFRNGEEIGGDYREIHNKVVTDAGRDAIVDAFTGAFTLSNFNYHHWGTGTTDEAVGQTALITPCAESRVAGTQSQPSSDVYKSVATITSEDTHAITEHGLFSAATDGTLLDRTKFAAINVISGDKIEFTFTLTFASGG